MDIELGDEPVLTNYQVSDVKSPTANSNYANNVSLLGTPRTLDALKHIHRIDAPADINIMKMPLVECSIEYDGIDILGGPGLIEITKVSKNAGDLFVFSCNVTSGTYNWVWVMDQIKLSMWHLNLGTHVKNQTNVTGSWAGARNFINGVYLPINYGYWYLPPATYQVITSFDLGYSPYIKSIVENALQYVGWGVSGGDWWGTVAEKLIMPHVSNYVTPGASLAGAGGTYEPYYGEDRLLPVNFKQSLWRTWPFTAQNERLVFDFPAVINPDFVLVNKLEGDVTNYNCPQDGQFTVPFDCQIAIEINSTGTALSGIPNNCIVRVVSNNYGTILSNTAIYDGGTTSGDANIQIAPRFYQAGDIITIFHRAATGTDTYTGYIEVVFAGRAVAHPTAIHTPTIRASKAIKNFRILDMLKGLREAFNLFFVSSSAERILYILTEREYYQYINQSLDITDFIECGAIVEVKDKICPNVFLNWKDDSADLILSNFKTATGGPVYGEGEGYSRCLSVTPAGGLDAETCEDVRNNSFFAPSVVTDENDMPLLTIHGEIAGGSTWNNDLTRNFEFRIAYYNGLTINEEGGDYGFDYDHNADGAGAVEYRDTTTGIPYAYMVDSWLAEPTSISLSFKNEFVYSLYDYFVKTEYRRNLRKQYHKWTLDALINRRKYEATLQANFMALFTDLSFRTFKTVSENDLGSGRFILDSIKSFSPEQGVGKATLYQLSNACDANVCRLSSELNLSTTATVYLDEDDVELDGVQYNVSADGIILGEYIISAVATVTDCLTGTVILPATNVLPFMDTVDSFFNTPVPLSEFGEITFCNTIQLTVEVENESGNICIYTICTTVRATRNSLAEGPIILSQETLPGACLPTSPLYTLSNCAYFGGDTPYPEGIGIDIFMYDSTSLKITAATVNGIEVLPEVTDLTQTTPHIWDETNAAYVQCGPYSQTEVVQAAANNFLNYTEFFNRNWAYDAATVLPDWANYPTRSQFPMLFRLFGTKMFCYYDSAVDFFVEMEIYSLGSLVITMSWNCIAGVLNCRLIQVSPVKDVTLAPIDCPETLYENTTRCIYSGAVIGGESFWGKWTNPQLIDPGFPPTVKFRYTISVCRINGEDFGQGETVTFNIPSDTVLGSSVYVFPTITVATNLTTWFNQTNTSIVSGVKLYDGGKVMEYNGDFTSLVLGITEEVLNASTNALLQVETWYWSPLGSISALAEPSYTAEEFEAPEGCDFIL